MLAVQVVSLWVGSVGSGAVDPSVRAWSYASTAPFRNCAVRPVIVSGESTTTLSWSGLAAEAPAETTVKLSVLGTGSALAVRDPAAIAPMAPRTASAAPRLARKVTSPNILGNREPQLCRFPQKNKNPLYITK